MKPLFLVGYMGCGKSTLGRKLARRLGVGFVDTDALVEEQAGASVADVFRYEGEARFREAEREALERAIAAGGETVVSTGGGLPTWSDNMQRMNGVGHTVFLHRTAEQIARRLSPYGRRTGRFHGTRYGRARTLLCAGASGRRLRCDVRRPGRGAYPEATRPEIEKTLRLRPREYPGARKPQRTIRRGRAADDDMLQLLKDVDKLSNNAPIGVFDSGLGGLTVWREVRRALPAESLVYLGDGKNCPYGSRPREEVRRLADEAVAFLVAQGCKLVVVACNTATAAAIDFLREKYAPMPIVGMEPAVKPACLATRSGVVGVLATERSLDGELFRRTAARYGDGVDLVTAPGRGFVELVENDLEATPEAEATVRAAVAEMLEHGADQIVLGCTHYPFLLPVLERVVAGRGVTVVDPSPAVARRVVQLLDRYGLHVDPAHRAEYTFRTFADEAYRLRLERKALGAL